MLVINSLVHGNNFIFYPNIINTRINKCLGIEVKYLVYVLGPTLRTGYNRESKY